MKTLCYVSFFPTEKYFSRVQNNPLYQSADDLDGCHCNHRASFDNGYVNQAAFTHSAQTENKSNNFSSPSNSHQSPQYEIPIGHNRPNNLRLSGRAVTEPKPSIAGRRAHFSNCGENIATGECRDEHFPATPKDPNYNDAHIYELLDMSQKPTPIQGAFSLPLEETQLATDVMELYSKDTYTTTQPDVQGSVRKSESTLASLPTLEEKEEEEEEEKEEEEEDGNAPLGQPSEPLYSEVKRSKWQNGTIPDNASVEVLNKYINQLHIIVIRTSSTNYHTTNITVYIKPYSSIQYIEVNMLLYAHYN